MLRWLFSARHGAAFLLPPVVVAWDGAGAPGWAQRLTDAAPYDLIRGAVSKFGAAGDYEVFGALVAPAFLLIGLALLPQARVAGRWTGVLAWLTLLGAPVVILSYVGHALPEPWHAMWGWEIPLLTAMAACGLVAGVLAFRPHRMPFWWSSLLTATVGVLTVSTVLFTYFPHGSLVGYGLEVAVLALGVAHGRGSARPRPTRDLPATRRTPADAPRAMTTVRVPPRPSSTSPAAAWSDVPRR